MTLVCKDSPNLFTERTLFTVCNDIQLHCIQKELHGVKNGQGKLSLVYSLNCSGTQTHNAAMRGGRPRQQLTGQRSQGLLLRLCAAFVSLGFCFPDVINGLLLQRALILFTMMFLRNKTITYLVKLWGRQNLVLLKVFTERNILSWVPDNLSCSVSVKKKN